MQRFDAQVLAYCLLGNHYHFVLHTRQANLSQLMRHINGVFTQVFTGGMARWGPPVPGSVQGHPGGPPCLYLLQVCRYVELNPVRAGMVAGPGDWPSSSYVTHAGG